MAAVSTVTQVLLVRLLGPTDTNPWLAAAVLLPLAAAVAFLARPLVRDRRVLLGGGFLAFFVAFCLLFAVAAGTDLLAGPRTELRGYDDATPRNWLGLGRFGDWRYALARPAPEAGDLLVVVVDSLAGKTREEARLGFARLIAQGVEREAKGIAFDFYLEKESAADSFLCRQLEAARAAGLSVLFGYRHRVGEGERPQDRRVDRVPLPTSLRDCLPKEQLGSVAGYREADGRIRRVPLYLRGDPALESLGLKAARVLAGGDDPALPASRLVQFLPPAAEPAPLAGWPTGEATEAFRDRFVFVGARGLDVHETPFGAVPGVRIHAWTAHALRTGAYWHRPHPAWILVLVFAAFYVLTLLQARGTGRRGLLLGAALLTAGFLGTAAAGAVAGWWIDVGHAGVGLWTLTGLLWGGARLQRGRLRADRAGDAAAPGTLAAAGPRDVFLSHNSRDKPAVRELAQALQARGLSVWLDEWELEPGRPWQEGLEEAIQTARSAAVVLGPSGFGPWEIAEMRACLSEGVDRDLPILPVLLPGAPEKPELPLFLRRYTWVDLRSGLSDEGLDRLEWGITGVKPRRVA